MWVSILLVLSITLYTGNSNPTMCDAPRTTDLKFSITSRRNHTGYWIAQVKLEHAANEVIGQQNSGPWEVDIDHTTTSCKGVDSVFLVATVSAPPRRPGPNYELVPGLGYYKLHTEAKPWIEARSICAQEGAHLAIINSDHEAEELKAILARHPKLFPDWKNEYVYIGINDIRTEGEWVTIFDEPLNSTGYMKWDPGQPDEGKNGNCGLIQRRALFHDAVCNKPLAFLCEQEVR